MFLAKESPGQGSTGAQFDQESHAGANLHSTITLDQSGLLVCGSFATS
jgi:hypothetical protein